ncbi:hypothetical protein BC940DRAFT_321089 [Gongronella butleri]|nr:hypothetical protein BC940DRAFT_321089 [Gongronella butleri]
MVLSEQQSKYVAGKTKKERRAEERAIEKERKHAQDDLDSLQITFFEIDHWIERTAPVLERMTKELDRASQRFEHQKQQQQQQQQEAPEQEQEQHQQAKDAIFQAQATAEQPEKTPVGMTQQDKDAMKWALSFLPGNALRLETNITSVDQLVEAVRRIHLLQPDSALAGPLAAHHATAAPHMQPLARPASMGSPLPALLATSHQETSATSDFLTIPWTGASLHASTECWLEALQQGTQQSQLDAFQDIDKAELIKLTENMSPHMLNYVFQVYWDCPHPKFSCDWSSFWDRCGDGRRNQLCTDAGLAMVFLHLLRHHTDACPNALAIGYSYYVRTRDALVDFFDAPDCATIEAMIHLAMFCVLSNSHPQARIQLSLAYRMMQDLGIHRHAAWSREDVAMCKKYMSLCMVLYYSDIVASMYSGEPPLVNDNDMAIDFYDLLRINEQLVPSPDAKTLLKDTFNVHLLAVLRIGKRALLMLQNYQKHIAPTSHTSSPSMFSNKSPSSSSSSSSMATPLSPSSSPSPASLASPAPAPVSSNGATLKKHDSSATRTFKDLPSTFVQQIQQLEVDLARWFDRLPPEFRTYDAPDESSTAPMASVQDHDAPELEYVATPEATVKLHVTMLLMMQYQAQWLQLHKSFANVAPSMLAATTATAQGAPPLPFGPDRSREICTDAANRLVVMGEAMVARHGLCVCQQVLACLYQASTVFCRQGHSPHTPIRRHALAMVRRIMAILQSPAINDKSLTDDLVQCLANYLQQQQDKLDSDTPAPTTPPPFNDAQFNSPRRHVDCMQQFSVHRPPMTSNFYDSDALLSIKLQDSMVDTTTLSNDQHHKNWRNTFSSSNVTQANHRIF